MFERGDKVIPIGKTIGVKSSTSAVMKEFKHKKLPYLYVTGYNSHDRSYICNTRSDTTSGDFFNEKDLIPYVVSDEEAFEMLVQNKISTDDYNKLIKK